MIPDIPIDSLISECASIVPDKIEDLYGRTPMLKDPNALLIIRGTGLLSEFYSNVKKELRGLLEVNPYL